MDRRRFLAAAGVLVSSGVALSACGSWGGRSAAGPPEGEPTLVLRNPSYELLAGADRTYSFLLTDADNRPLEVAEVDVWVADAEEQVQAGPFTAVFFDEGEETFGTFRTVLDVPEPGITFLYAVSGQAFGRTAIDVVDAADSILPAPGQPAIPSPTPTTHDDFAWEALCTRDPDCGMHETSLADALADGRPVLLAFATPAYCQTTVCAPAVDVIDEVRRSATDWGDLAFIHVEIYTDAASTVTPPVLEWGLPTEPWYFAIDRAGVIVDRRDGPLVSEDVVTLIEAVR